MKRTVATLAILAATSFALHLAWEFFHVGLYGGYEHLTSLPITVWATIGDVLYTVAAFGFIALLKRSLAWLEHADAWDYASISATGMFIATFVESKALAFGRWYYLDAMPIVPVLGIGLSPLAQMVILLPISFVLTRVLLRRIGAPNPSG
jgi:hypothetical protein